ncbi:MAG: c-type cytochrome [Pseudomonadales bacterium]|nr:c-type cytochrome [Pseudomonadales bacterium]
MKDPAHLKRGEMIYTGTCGGYCHNRSSGVADAPNLFDCTWLHGGSDEEIFHTITTGVPGTRMIGFGGKLPKGDEDIWSVIAYLKSKRHC